ncbi:MAG: DUF2088 domain-containing protein, partial [Deltaproteobacteria bacterium]|nr:DUF2088 domain-containing protein [Deltaproteobacteria bacterium]
MATVEQRLYERDVGPIGPAVERTLATVDIKGSTSPGDAVAVAVGSRGISELPSIVEGVIGHLRRYNLKPFIVPAMGSHGGGTAEGESKVLARLGITESTVGAPIKAGSDVVQIGTLDPGPPVVVARHAASADHIVVVNRVKPHTKFRAPIESGLTKMLTVGLGKARGATLYHQAAVNHGFTILQDAAALILKNFSVLFGLAVLEDGRRHVAKITSVTPEGWFETEQALLKEALAMFPVIPFDGLDILIVDEIGKHISGIGMDSNVTGRHRDIIGDFFVAPHVKRIFVRDLSPHSDGNATGIGL